MFKELIVRLAANFKSLTFWKRNTMTIFYRYFGYVFMKGGTEDFNQFPTLLRKIYKYAIIEK